MGFLKIFKGKQPEEHEQLGDNLFYKQEYGASKIEYETALSKLDKKSQDNQNNNELKNRLIQKITDAKNNLALYHKQTAEELMEAKSYDEAKDLFNLAFELTSDSLIQDQLTESLEEIEKRQQMEVDDFVDLDTSFENIETEGIEKEDFLEQIDEHFTALCEALKDEVKKEYYGYGENFKIGYVALNNGNFELALTKLNEAKGENKSNNNYLSLELAKAHLNLKNHEESQILLENFLKAHPDSIESYHLLCEIYWELEEFDKAQQFLDSSPSDFKDLPPIKILQGETLLRAKKYEEAEALFTNYLKSFGWNESIVRSLAIIYEAIGKKEDARDLYEELMQGCQGCGAQIDPFIKLRYAELCFELGEHSVRILELYLSIAHEDPINKAYYFRKISQIYSNLGNEKEARRYMAFANRIEDE